jgi:hypothetical protein
MEAGSVVESDWRRQNENKILVAARVTGTNREGRVPHYESRVEG